MSDYTYHELMQMQNDAIKRVEEMQKKARVTAGLDEKTVSPKSDERDKPRHIPMPEGFLKQPQNAPQHEELPVKPLTLRLGNSDIEIDSDKALLLSLILLLAEEQADEMLLAALVYMLG